MKIHTRCVCGTRLIINTGGSVLQSQNEALAEAACFLAAHLPCRDAWVAREMAIAESTKNPPKPDDERDGNIGFVPSNPMPVDDPSCPADQKHNAS